MAGRQHRFCGDSVHQGAADKKRGQHTEHEREIKSGGRPMEGRTDANGRESDQQEKGVALLLLAAAAVIAVDFY